MKTKLNMNLKDISSIAVDPLEALTRKFLFDCSSKGEGRSEEKEIIQLIIIILPDTSLYIVHLL